MKFFLKELKIVYNELLSEKESLLFLALFSRKDEENRWDLIISANWIEAGRTREVVKLLLEKFKKQGVDYSEYIENIVVLNHSDNFLHHLAAAYKNKGEKIIKEKDGVCTIKLFDDFQIKAVVLHEKLDELEIKTLTKKRENEKVLESVF
jgi:hypothetical protein